MVVWVSITQLLLCHISVTTSQNTGNSTVCSTGCPSLLQIKHKSSALLCEDNILVTNPYPPKGASNTETVPFHDVIKTHGNYVLFHWNKCNVPTKFEINPISGVSANTETARLINQRPGKNVDSAERDRNYIRLAESYKKSTHYESMVSCQKGPTRHAYTWQIGPFWQETLGMTIIVKRFGGKRAVNLRSVADELAGGKYIHMPLNNYVSREQ